MVATTGAEVSEPGSEDGVWRQLVLDKFQQSIDEPTAFFNDNADLLSRASLAVARRFDRGGRLLVFGSGSNTTDAQHVSVEFVHPVIVGKQALPAIALTNDVATALGLMQQSGPGSIFDRQIELLGSPDDAALGLTLDGNDESVLSGLVKARKQGMLTIGMCGMDGGAMLGMGDLDFCFHVASPSADVVQEVQETTYHILWETVHIFFEHKGLWTQDAN